MAVIITEPEARKDATKRPLRQRLLWFVALWGLGVLTIFAVGTLIRTVVFS